MFLKCKCHGLSGSCEVKTCWWSQPDFRVIGDYMKDKYDSASEMVVEKHKESRGWVETLRPKYNYFKPPTERDLVYYESSPNFCDPNPETGSFGTRDRICNLTSHGIDGCDLLCCGRGHNTRTEKRKEKCHCIFHWCCYVSCQECVRVYDVHTCKWRRLVLVFAHQNWKTSVGMRTNTATLRDCKAAWAIKDSSGRRNSLVFLCRDARKSPSLPRSAEK